MKKILSILLLFISVAAISQPSNYLNIRSRYNLIAVKTDSGFHVPCYSTIPNYRGGVWGGAGNIGVDTVNNKFYFYSGGAWREAGSTNYADSLRRSGLAVQMRKNGNWTTQFNLPDSAGSSYTFTNGITESGGTVTLTNDTTAFANSFYGTNAVGRRGYRPLSEIIPTLQQVLTAGNVLTANNLIDLGTTSRLRIKGGKLYDAINFTAYDPANNDSSHITISGGYVTAIAMGVKRSNAGAYLKLSNNGFDFQTVSGVKTTTRTVFQQYNIYAITDSTGFIMGKDSFLLTKSSSSTSFQNLDLLSYNNAAKFKWSPNGVVIRNGIGFYDNHSSAILDVYSKTKGVLLTRHTTAEMLAVPNPANGLVTYNTDSLAYCYFNGTAWKKIAGSESSMAISGNYGNIQLNRNGALATPASDSLSFTDKLNVKGNIVGTSKLILGATSAPAQSQVYVTGGVSGGNIDARGDSSSAQKDEANIEAQHADYDGSSFTGYGVALQANGNVSSGTLLGYSNKNSAQLRFTGDVNVIRTLTNRSLRFGVNNVEKLVIDSIGRVGIGVINPDSTLHVNGSFKLVNGTQGAGKVLTSDANGGASWADTINVKYITSENGISGISGINSFSLSNDEYNPVFDISQNSSATGYNSLFNINPADGLHYDNVDGNDNTFQNHLAINNAQGFALEIRTANDALEMKMNSESFALAQNNYASARPTVTNILTATLAEGVVIHPEDGSNNKMQIKNGKITFDYDGDNWSFIDYDAAGVISVGSMIFSSGASGHTFYDANIGDIQARISGHEIYTGYTASESGVYLSAGLMNFGESGLYSSANSGTIAGFNQLTDRFVYGNTGSGGVFEFKAQDSAWLSANLFIKNPSSSINLWSESFGSYLSWVAGDGEMHLSIDGNNYFTFYPGNISMYNGAYTSVINNSGITAIRNYDLPDASGTLIASFKNTTSLNFGSTAAQSSSSLTMTVTNAAVGDAVVLDVVTGGNYMYTAHVSADNTVTVTLHNYSSAAVDPAATSFTAIVIKKG